MGCCACALPRSASAVTAPASCTSFMVFPPVGHAGSNGLLGNLDEVAVRIAYVHRADLSPRAGLHHRSLYDRHVARGKASDHLREGHCGDKADVERAGQGRCRPGLEFPAFFVEIDLLAAELEGHAAFPEAVELHAEHPRVEIVVLLGSYRVRHDVIKRIDEAACLA